MKVGIFTYHFSDNYGALFQAYSLRQWLHNRGLEAEFVNYHPKYVEEGGSLDRPWKLSLWRKNLTILYMKQAYARRKLFGDRAQKARFEQFRRDALSVSGTRIKTAEDLSDQMAQYDMLICGSDQIWNPSIQRGLDPVYFLDIPGSTHAYKTAYAPSFGRSVIDAKYNAQLADLVTKLDGVSVREATGLDVLGAAGVPRERACVVPDPTVLLGNFDDLLEDNETFDPSIFCYALRTDEVIRDVAIETSRLTGFELRSPRTAHQRWTDIGQGTTPGPIEWLKTLARAKMVISNSFHGVALSIVLNRPLIAVGLPGKRAAMNARVQNLLNIAGLTDRIVDTANPNRIKQLLADPIDWQQVNSRLALVRFEAEAYLDEQIKFAQDFRT